MVQILKLITNSVFGTITLTERDKKLKPDPAGILLRIVCEYLSPLGLKVNQSKFKL